MNNKIAKLVEAAKYVILTGEGISALDEAVTEYERWNELAEVIVVNSYEDDNEVGC